jgi:hypothetical protein
LAVWIHEATDDRARRRGSGLENLLVNRRISNRERPTKKHTETKLLADTIDGWENKNFPTESHEIPLSPFEKGGVRGVL